MEKEKKKRTAHGEGLAKGKPAGRQKKAVVEAAGTTEGAPTEAETETVMETAGTAAEAKAETAAEAAETAPETAEEASTEADTEAAAEVAEIAPETAEEASEEANTEAAAEVAETALETAEEVSAEAGTVREAVGTRPAVAGQKAVESPHMRIEKEFRERTRVIREQLVNIQKSFVTIGFQLHWIKSHKMFKIMDYKNIYDYAEKEYGIGRASCCNLICIIENFADRDEYGNVIESIADCYRNYSSSQLVAMIGMPESMKKEVTPDMSVRAINRMRRGLPDKQAEKAAGVPPAAAGENAGTGKAAVTAEGASPVQSGPAADNTVRQEENAMEAEEIQMPAKEPDIRAEKAAAEDSEPPAAEAAAGEGSMQAPAVPAAVVEAPMQEPALTTEKASVQKPAAPEEASVQEAAVSSAPEEPLAGNREKGEKEGAASTLFTFDSYSTYRKAREKVNELIEKVFSRDIPVTVKIVCMEG